MAELAAARALQAAGKLLQAERAYQAILQQQPGHPEVLAALRELYLQQGREAEAQTCSRHLAAVPSSSISTAAAAPDLVAAQLMQQAISLYQAGCSAEAVGLAQRSVVLDPTSAAAQNNLAVMHKARQNYPAAEQALRAALALRPIYPEALANLGNVLWVQHRSEEALEFYRQAVELAPANPVNWNNLGLALQSIGQVGAARTAFERAVSLDPGFGHAHWNLAITALLQKDYLVGWQEYEWGLQIGVRPANYMQLPRWDGNARQRVLVYAEQGLGDTLQFIRYVPLLQTRVADLAVVVPPPLQSIVQRTFPSISIVLSQQVDETCFDAAIPLMSLPYRLGLNSEEQLCVPVPYMQADPARVEQWRERLGRESTAIGLAWQGSRAHQADALRSIPAEMLQAALPGYALHSLQAGPDAPPAPSGVADWRECIQDFEDLAAILTCMKYVVVVDTAVAHLAGALGVKTVVLLPYAPDWRWGEAGECSQWYPSLMLVRQQKMGGWDASLAQLKRAVNEFEKNG